MKLKHLNPADSQMSQGVEALADTLRRVAADVERGEIRQIVMTVIRADGLIERLGNVAPPRMFS